MAAAVASTVPACTVETVMTTVTITVMTTVMTIATITATIPVTMIIDMTTVMITVMMIASTTTVIHTGTATMTEMFGHMIKLIGNYTISSNFSIQRWR